MLMCKVLKSPKPHARILHIDTSRAQALPGVRAVITGRDVPDARFGNGAVKDKRLFALDKVRYIGEPVAAVAAVDEITAALPADLTKALNSKLPALETLAISANSGPCLKGAGPSDDGPGRQPA
jgi:CO/xanthine dehydrogenase Mo-binding subunit